MSQDFVKFCGFTHEQDIAAALHFEQVRALGFIAFPKSPRHISAERYAKLTESIPHSVQKVLVTVNADDDFLAPYIEAGVDVIQLHGKESAERSLELQQRGLECWKAVTLRKLADVEAYANFPCSKFIIDAVTEVGEVPGGSGKQADWPLAAKFVQAAQSPVLLAGGITPENVQQALAEVKPAGFDLSSGIELSPGIKSLEKMSAFIGAL